MNQNFLDPIIAFVVSYEIATETKTNLGAQMLSRHNFDILFFGGILLLISLHLFGVSAGMLILLGFVIFFPGIVVMFIEAQEHMPPGSFSWNPRTAQISCRLAHWLVFGSLILMFYPLLRFFLFLGFDPRKFLKAVS